MKMKLAPLALAVAFVSVACGDTPDTNVVDDVEPTATVEVTEEAVVNEETEAPAEPAELPAVSDDQPVFEWTETGGCMQGGPNCARYVVTADGTVLTYRQTFPVEDRAVDPEVTGTVDAETLAAWMNVVAETDVDALVERAGPGEMTAAFDGIDFVVSAPHAGSTLSSVDIEFSPSEEYFDSAIALAAAARSAAPLEIEMRR